MTNAISQAHSLDQVVEIINSDNPAEYAGGTDLRSSEVMAGQYGWEAALESGYTSDKTIEAQLDILRDAGAEFDFREALDCAIALKNASRPAARTLREYIDEEFYGSNRDFAAAQGVQPPQVTQWLNKDFIVVNESLYSPRRELKK
ncbi:hypothetical protein V6259_12750 [Marinomonas sp. TI.3.20]|uniref:hypothetical protein n=1 Tax=Marinomonas sp. TI.3.20 TaxID=3121296 RepID=UPI00311DF401